ncbi:MAG: Nif3-like dinuclear metal center hexameric protein [Legionellaceae bacterium]|nr:Nif3-like dinuclear metal center hexameric protein [Legionellaceae bacterium]
MITRNTLATYLNDFLACEAFQDYAPNGLQVEGRLDIKTICTAVTASESVIEEAVAMGADALLVHHGFFWRGEDAVITGMRRRRIGHLLKHDLNLFAYHLPLDCHPTLGNNVFLGNLLQIQNMKSYDISKVANILWAGDLSSPVTAEELSQQIARLLQRKPMYIPVNDKPIKRIAWCSGGAQDYIEQAKEKGVDAYLSGEISERTYYQAKELNIHYFACGHHATERFGIQSLGKHLAMQFHLTHHFIDSDNPV